MSNLTYEVRISDTFTQSLGKLNGEEQKSTKTTAFDLQLDPSNPGMQFHRIDKCKDKHFWSVRINRDLRLIVHKSDSSLLLCYVDHHDKAYAWAERRKIEIHPRTGAAQLVEIRETIQEILVPNYVNTPFTKPKSDDRRLFNGISEDELLSYGVPTEWLQDVSLATENSLLRLVDHLPSEAAEALLELATGGKPRKSEVLTIESTNPFDHPDAQRRFRVMSNLAELQTALEYPWDKWMVFLHPEQKQLVERKYNGPARV